MFIWGSKGGVADLGAHESKHCPICEKQRSFRLMLRYKVSHLWYVINWVSEKQYGMVCEVCNRGDDLATQAVEAKLGKPKIPTQSSRAWMALAAAFVGLFVLGSLVRPGELKRMEGLLAAPQKTDIYVVDLATLQKSPQALAMYGLFRVHSVEGERVNFDTPIVAYEKQSRAEKDLHNGKLADPAYFSGEPLTRSRSEIAAWQHSGVLKSIHRP
jgi:hypothetical protein